MNRKKVAKSRSKQKKNSVLPIIVPNGGEVVAVSKRELKKRLRGKMSKTDIEKLLDAYVQAALDVNPDMTVMTQLAQKHRATTLLDVRFRLETEQYDALAEYFQEEGQPGTFLVKKAIENFIV